jgi:hypothetical protein
MLFIFALLSCISARQPATIAPIAIVEIDTDNIEGIYVPPDYKGIIVAGPFEQKRIF